MQPYDQKAKSEELLKYGSAMLANNCESEAIKALQNALSVDPFNHEIREKLIEAQVVAEKVDDAYLTFKDLEDPRKLPENVQLGLANLLASKSKNDDALEVLGAMLSRQPDHIVALTASAQLLGHTGKWSQAEKQYRLILELDPGNVTVRSILGVPPEPEVPLAFLRSFLKPIANKIPIFKQLALFVMESVIRQRAKNRIHSRMSTMSDWIHYGRELWIAHPSYHGNETLMLETPGNKLKISDRLLEEERVKYAMPDNISSVNDTLREENKKWALQVAALEDAAGYWHTMMVSDVYERRKYNMRNHCLFSEFYGAESAYHISEKAIPEKHLKAFAMDGLVEIESGYIDQRYPESFKDLISDADFDRYDLASTTPEGASLDPNTRFTLRWFGSSNGQTDDDFLAMLPGLLARNKTAAVFGATGLFLEAACVRLGAKETTTIRYVPFENNSSKINGMTLAEWDEHPLAFDLVVAINTVDTFGLGMCGEPIEPDADLQLMQRFRDMVKPGGRLVLSVPIGRDRIVFNTSRIYGEHRLPLLFKGWEIAESPRYDEALMEGKGLERPLFVLKKREEDKP